MSKWGERKKRRCFGILCNPFFVFIVLAFLHVPTILAAPLRPLHPDFMIPHQGILHQQALFWIKIYSHYSTQQGVLHDARYPQVIYEEISFDQNPLQLSSLKEKYKKILQSLHQKNVENDLKNAIGLTGEEKRVYDLFLKIKEPQKFLRAASLQRIRFQRGQKDLFLEGLKESGRYLPFMEAILIQKKLPIELSRLPFVESHFNTKARSKVGASGIWQFMESTARQWIEVDGAIDERNDPIRATEAASALLQINYRSLGKWPLAVTAYNHGRMSLMKAVRKLGTDSLEEIIELNQERSFGFASRNFFACLLAAIEVERNAEKYFGVFDRKRPHLYYEVPLPQSIFLKDLVSFMGLKKEEVLDLNPGLLPATVLSKIAIPSGYRLRLLTQGDATEADQKRQMRVFLSGFRKIPSIYKKKRAASH